MAQFVFDARQVAPQTGFDPVPAGWYNVMIDEAEFKPTRDGSGTRLNVRYVILDGQYQGRKVYHGLNLQNANAQTVEIAYKQLSAICHAIGRLEIQQTEHLLNVPLKIKVKVRPADGQYDEQNDITQWKNINEQVGAVPAANTGAPAAGWTPPPAQQQQPAPQQQQGPQGWGAPPANAQPATPWGAPPQQQQAPQQQFAPPAQPQQQPAQAGWTPPANAQPWANGQPQQQPAPGAAQPAAATPPAPQGQNPAQGAAPPWHRPQG